MIFDSPRSYGAVLKRILVVHFAASMICYYLMLSTSIDLTSVPGPRADMLLGKDIPVTLILVAAVVPVVCRVVKAHDRISDVLSLRRRFDSHNILDPLAKGAGIDTKAARWMQLRRERRAALMSRIFYAYASFSAPKIDPELVWGAADAWGWFWCLVEIQVTVVLALFLALVVGDNSLAVTLVVCIVLLNVAAFAQYPRLRERAEAQVVEILAVKERRDAIKASICELDVQFPSGRGSLC